MSGEVAQDQPPIRSPRSTRRSQEIVNSAITVQSSAKLDTDKSGAQADKVSSKKSRTTSPELLEDQVVSNESKTSKKKETKASQLFSKRKEIFSTRDLRFLKLRIASPTRIRSWGTHKLPNGKQVGRITKAETINYRTYKPEMDGLFCERAFGPVKDWECHCGRTKGQERNKDGIPIPRVCTHCGVELRDSKIRRHRMGYIELVYPVVHIWYLKSIPSYLGVLLDKPRRELEAITYCTNYASSQDSMAFSASLLFPTTGSFRQSKDSMKWEYLNWFHIETYLGLKEATNSALVHYGKRIQDSPIEVGLPLSEDPRQFSIGAQAIACQLRALNLRSVSRLLSRDLYIIDARETRFGALEEEEMKRRSKLIRRLQLIHYFMQTKAQPEWMVIKALPVLPPDLRPIVQLEGGRFATTDLNDLYRRVLNRNNRFMKLHKMVAPETLIRSEKRLLQEAVDGLFDNGKRGKPVLNSSNRPLKSLADALKGKQGRFRQNLLGKRVDYSGRSVIVVGPKLRLHQCGLPKEMALELFQPLVIRLLLKRKVAPNIRYAKKLMHHAVARGPENPTIIDAVVWDTLAAVVEGYPILLNRAPTLHRLGIQAFEPVLINGRAIQLHPLVCTGFNADFDGDQMGVHIPLSAEARAEAKLLMLASHNLLSPATGQPIVVPSQDMVLGWYYLTTENPWIESTEGLYFSGLSDVEHAYHQGQIHLHSIIWVRWGGESEGSLGDEFEDNPLEIRIDANGHSWHIYSQYQLRYDDEGDLISQFIRTTTGRVVFNQLVHRHIEWSLHDQVMEEIETEFPESVLPPDVMRCLVRLYSAHAIGERPAMLGLASPGTPSPGRACAYPPRDDYADPNQIKEYLNRIGHW
uniref:DNA-directed RNA polymerase subunit beta' n=1 Tax=Nephroselmis olivacea TaxID=31312 RepID=RPOC1_NEPOL|nr:RNA polymerase beta' chain [Nephroselmis olivacea]Q9TL05.1 RecName: Full=DNA-directed RNA polymerase subunit beta'; AltName: Full=PEP; AltName: Full=Plastid-encoded RNA polymerase subunit beta'; Short=RNA polymerase subunit beta' [Nephroselmis olivacea]AAD54811.1 beta' subunit of RNA polymerase [Nephroselmis olivacea]